MYDFDKKIDIVNILIFNNNKRKKHLNSCIILMGYSVRGEAGA